MGSTVKLATVVGNLSTSNISDKQLSGVVLDPRKTIEYKNKVLDPIKVGSHISTTNSNTNAFQIK